VNSETLLHIMPGLVMVGGAGLTVFLVGGRLEKQVMGLVLLVWLGAAAGQVLSGRLVEPLIIGDLFFACCMVWLLSRSRRHRWLYAVFAVQVGRLIVDALLYHRGGPPSGAYRVISVMLSASGLAIVTIAALWRGWARPDDPRGL
jgi:hypothetical protein